MERCPVCRARLKDEPVCHRCGADSSVLLAIEAEVAVLERQAVALLGTGKWIEAHRTAERILALQSSPLAAAVLDQPPGTDRQRSSGIGAAIAVNQAEPLRSGHPAPRIGHARCMALCLGLD